MAKSSEDPVLVIGLGRFGVALAQELTAYGHELMAVDIDHDTVQHHSEAFTSVVQADATDRATLEQLGVGQFGTAVVGIGTSLEHSVLTVVNLVDLGLDNIWAQATSRTHGQILTRIGASHVIYPEQDAGERAAHLLAGTMRNFTEFSEGYALAHIQIPGSLAGTALRDLGIKDKYGVTVVAYEDDDDFHPVSPDTQLPAGQLMIVAGPTEKVDEFAKRI